MKTFLRAEIFAAGLPHTARRVPEVSFTHMDARRVTFVDEFDTPGAFDVIEHIAEKEEALAGLHRALRSGGTLILTVPKHPWLWSAAGFELLRSSSFVSLLLPLMTLSRWRQRRGPGDYHPSAKMRVPAWLNAGMTACLGIELAAMKLSLDGPAGGSRLVVA